jgi:hypothetical protein
MVTGLISAIILLRWTHRTLDAAPPPEGSASRSLWFVRAGILLTGVAVALVPGTPSWTSVFFRGLTVAVVSLPCLLWSDPALAKAVHHLRRILASPQHSAAIA